MSHPKFSDLVIERMSDYITIYILVVETQWLRLKPSYI